jgi:hypothetical protein
MIATIPKLNTAEYEGFVALAFRRALWIQAHARLKASATKASEIYVATHVLPPADIGSARSGRPAGGSPRNWPVIL